MLSTLILTVSVPTTSDVMGTSVRHRPTSTDWRWKASASSADTWEQQNLADGHPDVVRELDWLLRDWEERHCDGLDPMRVNAAETPHGATYAAEWTRRFQQDGVPMLVRFERRKPEETGS